MQVIINLPKSSTYSKFNGLTFDAVEANSSFVSVIGLSEEFPENKVDLSLKEIIIVSVDVELNAVREWLTKFGDNNQFGEGTKLAKHKKLLCIERYITMNKINVNAKNR